MLLFKELEEEKDILYPGEPAGHCQVRKAPNQQVGKGWTRKKRATDRGFNRVSATQKKTDPMETRKQILPSQITTEKVGDSSILPTHFWISFKLRSPVYILTEKRLI